MVEIVCCNIPAVHEDGVYISQLTKNYILVVYCSYYEFLYRRLLLKRKILNWLFSLIQLKTSLQKFHGRPCILHLELSLYFVTCGTETVNDSPPLFERLILLNICIPVCCNFYLKNTLSYNKLEAQWTEAASLTFHSALRKLNTQPSIHVHVDASYQVSVHLAWQFQRRRFFRYWPIRNKNCLCWPCLLTNRDEMSNLHRGHSIDDACHVSVNLAKWFQRRFKKKWPFRNKNCL